MLYIYKYTKPQNIKVIENTDSHFDFLLQTGETFDDDIYVEIMKRIDGISIKNGACIETRFGTTDLSNLSSGCKALLLCLYYSKNKGVMINSIMMGNNVTQLLLKLSTQYDMRIKYSLPFDFVKVIPIKCKIDDDLYMEYDKLILSLS